MRSLCALTMLALSLANFGAAAQAPPARGRLAQIMTADMLNIQVAYLESLTGPARRITPNYGMPGQQREYRVEGCALVALVSGSQVHAYRLSLSQACSFDLRRMVPNFTPATRAHQASFGQWAAAMGGRFLPACLMDCGNAADPAFSVHVEGSRADGFIEVILTAIHNNPAAGRAADALAVAAERRMSRDAVIDGRFPCHADYQRVAQQAFRDVRPAEITIGYGLEALAEVPACR